MAYKKNRSKFCIVLFFLAALAMLAGCSGPFSAPSDNSSAWGRSDAKEIDVTSKIPGRVVMLSVKEGDKVKKGQIIAQIDQRDLQTQKEQAATAVYALQAQAKQAGVTTDLQRGTSSSDEDSALHQAAQAKSNLDLAASNYKRFQTLVAEGAISQQTFDTYATQYKVAQDSYAAAQAAVDKAHSALLQVNADQANEESVQKKIDQGNAALQQIEVALDETEIRAPFDGIITQKYVEEGSMVSQGMPLISIQDPTDNWVDFKVPETNLSDYHIGDSMILEARDGKTKVKGTITDISKKADFATTRATSERGDSSDIISFNVKVRTNSELLRPGMRFRIFQKGSQ
jgi:HlyD family secretion protein